MLGKRRAMSRATWSSRRWFHIQRWIASGITAQPMIEPTNRASRTHCGVSVTRSRPNCTR